MLILFINTEYSLITWIRDLLNVFRKLDLRNIVTIRILNTNQIVHSMRELVPIAGLYV